MEGKTTQCDYCQYVISNEHERYTRFYLSGSVQAVTPEGDELTIEIAPRMTIGKFVTMWDVYPLVFCSTKCIGDYIGFQLERAKKVKAHQEKRVELNLAKIEDEWAEFQVWRESRDKETKEEEV
jgi:hypothetical protein